MTMRKLSFALAGLMLAALSVPPTLAQDSADASPGAMLQISEEALGISDPSDASDSIPDPATFAAVASMLAPGEGDVFVELAPVQTPAMDAGAVSVQVADKGGPPGPPHGGPGGGPWHGGPGGWHHGGPFGMLHGDLALTNDQFQQLYSIKESTADSLGPKKLELHTAFRNLMDALGAGSQDSGKIKSLQDRIASLKSDISNQETGKLVQMSQVLTADQRNAIHMAMIKASLGGFHHHGGHHGPPGMHPGG
jgi:Spy/CpxP family protein refolding chaperone